MTYLFIYRMTSDNGLAPCAEKGLLSLACCKGGQMRGEKVVHTGLRHFIGAKRKNIDYSKDKVYVLGTYNEKMLYLAKITNVVTMEQYYSGMSKGRTDDIYKMENGNLVRNEWLKEDEVHTEPGRVKRDLAGKYVLLSDEYIYLGEDAAYIDSVARHNAKFQETKTYSGNEAEMIISDCMKYKDNKKHLPTKPFKARGGCR